MQPAFRLVAWANLLPFAALCLIAPVAPLEALGLPAGPMSLMALRYLGVAYAVLFVANASAVSRPSVWKPVLALDLLLYGGSAFVPLSLALQGLGVTYPLWGLGALDAVAFLLVAGFAVRTFWLR